MNDDVPGEIRVALSVAKQVYALKEGAFSQNDFCNLVSDACERFDWDSSDQSKALVSLIAAGMLKFAEHVEVINGVDVTREISSEIANDPKLRDALVSGLISAAQSYQGTK